MFDQLVLSGAQQTATHKRWTVACSALGESMLLAVLVVIPLLYTEALPSGLLRTIVVAPLVPAPKPPVAPSRTSRSPRVINLRNITAPGFIPNHVSVEPVGGPPVIYQDGSAANSQNPGPLSNLFRPNTAPPAPPAAAAVPRIRQGGLVQEALIVHRVVPQYPPIAVASHITGTIVLHAIIATDGTVQELAYVSGPPFLAKAAMYAVKQWRYQPTLLNGQPVEVETTISVVFTLGG